MKIVIVDDHPLARQGLVSILSKEDGLELVVEAASVDEAVGTINNTHADIAFVDTELRDEDGLDTVRKCREKRLNCKFIVMSSTNNKEVFRRANKEGIHGYLTKEALPEEFVIALRLVARGRKYFDPSLLAQALRPDEGGGIEQLTLREREVLAALGEGLNNKKIAKRLFITEYTVKKHVSQILAKLGLNGRTQAALYANSNGIAL